MIGKLEELTNGLLWLSESDYPWRIVTWESQLDEENSEEAIAKLDAQIRNQLAEINPDQDPNQIESQELDDCFQEAITSKDWYAEEELAECQRYQDLVNFLENFLSGVRVYRLGEVEVKIYVLGQTPSNNILGIETISVET